MIADHVQELAARKAGVPGDRMVRFATQHEAVAALPAGTIDAYPSVTLAHHGHLTLHRDAGLTIVDLHAPSLGGEGRSAAFGAYSFSKQNSDLRPKFDHSLQAFPGALRHREIMQRYGFVNGEIDRVL